MNVVLDQWVINTENRVASRHGETQTLSPRAVRLLVQLSAEPIRVFSRAELMEQIWPDVIVSDESLTQVVAEVRRKLGNKDLVKTIAKSGYQIGVAPKSSMAVAPTHWSAYSSSIDTLEAHALCLEARAEMVRCGQGSLERAYELTAEAVSLAPESADVRAEYAIALVRSHTYWSEGRELLREAQEQACIAVRLNPELPLALSALGYACSMGGHWDAAEAAHTAALANNPRDPVVLHNVAWYLMSLGRTRAAVAYFEQVGDLEPQNVKGYMIAAQLLRDVDPQRSRRNAERALQRARARIEADPTDPRALSAAATMMAVLGDHHASHSAMNQLDVQENAQAIYHAAAMAMIGDTEQAVLLLEGLFDHGWRDTFWLDAEPSFAALRDNRRFSRMRRSLAAA